MRLACSLDWRRPVEVAPARVRRGRFRRYAWSRKRVRRGRALRSPRLATLEAAQPAAAQGREQKSRGLAQQGPRLLRIRECSHLRLLILTARSAHERQRHGFGSRRDLAAAAFLSVQRRRRRRARQRLSSAIPRPRSQTMPTTTAIQSTIPTTINTVVTTALLLTRTDDAPWLPRHAPAHSPTHRHIRLVRPARLRSSRCEGGPRRCDLRPRSVGGRSHARVSG